MIIKVTQEHITNGKRRSRSFCPISLALRDVFGRDCDPRVGDWHIALGALTYYDLPKVAKAFISLFDAGSSAVSPFSFELIPKKNWYG